MKILIAAILATAVAIALAMYAQQDPGYIVMSREWAGKDYTISMPLALFALFLFVGFVLLYLLINFLFGLFRAPKAIGKWRKGKKEVSAQQHTMRGFAGLIEGNWQQAEGHLLTKLDHNKASLMNYLGAAYAAQQQGQLARRNQHLETALKAHPRQELAIKLTRARMQMQAGEWGDARDQLEYLRLSAPKSVATARLLADTYRELGDWPALVKMLPALSKLKAFPAEELQSREKQALSNHIEAPALLQGDQNRVDETFKALPRKVKKDASALASYARQLVRSGEHQRAETVVRRALNREWNADLVRLYGQIETRNIRDQVKLLESWGRKNPDDANLMFSMARLLRRDGKLDEAKTLLAQLLARGDDPEVINEMGELLEQLGEHDSALQTYKRGLKSLAPPTAVAAEEIAAETSLVTLDDGTVEVENTMPVVSEATSDNK